MINGNVMVMQSGGCTAVINRSLTGIIRSARNLAPRSRILGADHGMEGLISGIVMDLTHVPQTKLHGVDCATGAALGSTRRKLRDEDIDPIFATLTKHDVRVLHIIGGNDSALTGLELSEAASQRNYELQIINVPKTIDNDLVETDHCPGYGSAARFVAQATLGAGRDAKAMGLSSPITIIEVMGRDSGWLAAAASLYKRDEDEPPHYIGVPEKVLREEEFLTRIEDAYRNNGYAIAVVGENVRGPTGMIGFQAEPWFVDDFGHPYYDSPARYLAEQVTRKIRVRCRYEKPGTIQRSMLDSVSKTDYEEAHRVGEAAVEAASVGERDVIVTLVRSSENPYTCRTGLTPLKSVAGKTKFLPSCFIPDNNGNIHNDFRGYLEPLVGLPAANPESLY